MIRSLFYIPIIGLILLLACSQEQKNNVFLKKEGISVDLSAEQQTQISSIFNDYKLIKLQTLPEVLLADISKVKMLNNSLYILTEGKNNGLFKFDSSGKYVQQLLKPGDGPGEYGYIENFDIEEDIIYLLDSKKLAIHKVDTAGAFQKSIKTGLFALDILKFEDLIFLYAGNALNGEIAKKLIAINEEGKIENTFLPIDIHQANYLNINPKGVFSKQAHSFSMLEPFGYEILEYRNKALTSIPILFGGAKDPKEFMEKEYDHIGHFLQSARAANIPILFSDFNETEKEYSFSIEYDGVAERKDVRIKKVSSQKVVIGKYLDDLVFPGQEFMPKDLNFVGYTAESTATIYYLESAELVERLNDKDRKEMNLKSSDNPYLIILKK